MALDILSIAAIGFIFFIGLVAITGLGYLILKFFEDKKKNPDYVKKYYLDFIDFALNNCPESILDFDLKLKTTKESEGRVLGKIKGYVYLQMPTASAKKEKKEQTPESFRHFVIYLPRKNEFSIIKPSTWKPKYMVAIIKKDELPEGLNGNLNWETAGVDFYKWFTYSVSDSMTEKEGVARKIKNNATLDFATDILRGMGKMVNEAVETDANLNKSIKHMSEHEVRAKR